MQCTRIIKWGQVVLGKTCKQQHTTFKSVGAFHMTLESSNVFLTGWSPVFKAGQLRTLKSCIAFIMVLQLLFGFTHAMRTQQWS
jgi:NADH:ubiquinone oxidoreductase subunit 3 (subunit A)